MSFTQFVKPYPDGYQDFESGGTPVTAAILNTNYDGFLLALNDWASNTEFDISSLGSGLTQAHQRITSLESTVSTKSTVTIRDLLSSGTKIGTIAINGSDYDLYAPSGGGGGSSVAWNQIQQTGTKIAEVTIDGTAYDVYSPTPIDEISDLTDVSITNLQNGQILKWNSTTSKWENSNESGGTGGHTIIDENGTSMTARAGLQFVGADVLDDATNNRTIVDVASAGGIDGVFIDTENIIKSTTTFTDSMSYIATEDCIIAFYIVGKSNTDGLIKIDDKKVGGFFASGTVGFSCFYNLKNGQTITVTNAHTGYSSDYTVYGIQTGTTHSKFQPVIYSTEEREIGVWEDGKPLYEKTFDLGSDLLVSTSSWTTLGITLDADKIVETKTTSTSGSFQGNILVYNDNGTWKGQTPRNGNDSSYVRYLTIVYTKTTDVAGSGSWTPQGVPTHHYSTDEQVIGTWIDGSTLYEKTFDLTIPNQSGSYVFTEAAISGLGTVVKTSYSQNGDGEVGYAPWYDQATMLFSGQTSSGAEFYFKSTYLSGRKLYYTVQYTKTS